MELVSTDAKDCRASDYGWSVRNQGIRKKTETMTYCWGVMVNHCCRDPFVYSLLTTRTSRAHPSIFGAKAGAPIPEVTLDC